MAKERGAKRALRLADSADSERKEVYKKRNYDARVPCAGFRVPSPPLVKPGKSPATPLLVHCPAGDGGVQDLNWYAKSLRIDENNDMAQEFLVEVQPAEGSNRCLSTFEVDRNTRHANATNKILNRCFRNPDTSEEDA